MGEFFLTEQDKPYPDSKKNTAHPIFPKLLNNIDRKTDILLRILKM